MQSIIAIIKFGATGPLVANLQDVLLAMIEHGNIIPMPPGERPTEKDLQKLTEKLKDEQAQSVYGESTTQLAFYFQLQNGLDDNLKGLAVDEKTADMLNKFLKELGLLDQADTFSIRGVVKDNNGKPQPDLTVIAFDKDLRNEEQLGAPATTNPLGVFRIDYTIQDFSTADGDDAKPDLLVRIYKNKEELIAESEIRFNASKDEVFDFIIAASTVSEWEQITSAVLPLLEDQKDVGKPLPPNELTSADIDFIAKDTGLDREQIRLWVLASSVALSAIKQRGPDSVMATSVRSHIPSTAASNINDKDTAATFAPFYGWFRDGKPQNLADLLKTPTDQLITSLENAVKQNYIPELDEKQIIAIEASINQLKLERVLKPAAEGEPASLGDVLNTIKADWLKDKLNHIVDLTTKTDYKAEGFLEQAKMAGLNNSQALQLCQTFYLGDITQKNIPLMKVLQSMVADDKQWSMKFLASLEPNEWLDLVYEHGTPPLSILTNAEYAENLQTAVEKLIPHEVLKVRLDSDTITFIPSNFANIKEVLTKYQDFDIANSNIDQFVEDNKIDLKTAAALAKLQHLKRLNASWDEVSTLVNTRIDDAEEITNYGKDQFKSVLKDHLPEQRLDEIYNQASALKAASIGLMGHMFPVLYGVSPAVMADRSLKSHKAQIDSSPTLRKLFGALDNCACDPCLSVLSPAAYLADLLKFIDGSPSAREELESRRPDIFDLELSCDNTKIELPQIDLAIEILENAVALPYSVPLPNVPIAIHPGTGMNWPPARTELPNNELVDGQNIGTLVHQALESTVKDKLGDLVAHKTWEAQSLEHLNENQTFAAGAYTGSRLGNSNWIVKDSYRTWSLHAQKETFSANLNGVFLELQKNKLNNDLIALANNTIPDAIKQYLKANALRQTAYDLPVTIEFGNVVQLPQIANSKNTEWEVEVTSKGKISATSRPYGNSVIGTFNLSDADGNSTFIRTLNAGLGNYFASFIEELKNHVMSADLINLINHNRVPTIVKVGEYLKTTTLDVMSWQYEVISKLKFIYQPASLDVAGLTYQSTANDRDLFTRPQNTNPLAYKTIATEDACFPWSLPYNQALNETRETLSAAGVQRLSLLESTTPLEVQYSSIEIAKERLGLSPAELILITRSEVKANNEANDKLLKIWGLETVKTAQIIKDTFSDEFINKPAFGEDGLLTRISILLQQSGLSFAEFDRLLESEFINPSALIAITEDSSANCSPSEMRLNKISESELAPFLDRLHRFVRLWRLTGWQVWELDLAIQANGIGNNSLNNASIVQIANLGLLKERLHLPIDILVSMVSGFSDKRYHQLVKDNIREIASLYNRLFQNRQLIDPPRQGLAFTASLSALDEPLKELIAASVGLRKTDLSFLLDSTAIDLPRAILNDTQVAKNELLQQIFRNVTLAKAVGLSLYDYESAWQLFQSNHFESPANLLSFLNELDFVKNSGFDWGELGYLLLDSTLNPSATLLELTAERAGEMLTALQVELKQLLSLESEALIFEQRAELVVKHMALATSLEPAFVSRLLTNYLYSAETTPEPAMQYLTSDTFINSDDVSNSSAFIILERLHKVALLNTKWKASLPELAWTTAQIAQADVFAGLVFDSLQPIEMTSQDVVTNWKKSTVLFQLVHTSPEKALVVDNYLSAYQSATGADKASVALTTLATSFSLSEATVEACVAKLGFANDQYLNPLHFDALIKLLSTVHQLGIDGEGLASLVSDTAFGASAELAGKLLKSRFSDSGWQKALRKINDALRIQQRDRLVDYLLVREGLRDVNDLYKHYLIDFEMSPCMNTTRMLQSTAAVQLFVQRCLFNLEQPNITPDQIDRKRWEWMQNYRVWEANRKVFLYPENWLFPEVRDDKSEAFQVFEQNILSNEPNDSNAKRVSVDFLQLVRDHSGIVIRGMYEYYTSTENIPKKKLLVIGRLPNEPQTYFWRECISFGEVGMRWSGWQKINADVSGEYVIPFVLEDISYLAWPVITKKIDENDPSKSYWHLKFKWASLSRGSNNYIRQSSGELIAPVIKDKELSTSFAFRVLRINDLGQQAYANESSLISGIVISCFCVPPQQIVDSGGGDNQEPSWNGINSRKLIGASEAEANLQLDIKLIVKYLNGSVPDSNKAVALYLVSVTHEYTGQQYSISGNSSIGTTNVQGKCTLSINLKTEYSQYIASDDTYVFNMKVVLPNNIEHEFNVPSTYIVAENSKYLDDDKPRIFTVKYFCNFFRDVATNQPQSAIPNDQRSLMKHFGDIEIYGNGYDSAVSQDEFQNQGMPNPISGYKFAGGNQLNDVDNVFVSSGVGAVSKWSFNAPYSVLGMNRFIVRSSSDLSIDVYRDQTNTWHYSDSNSRYYLSCLTKVNKWLAISESPTVAHKLSDYSAKNIIKIQQANDKLSNQTQGSFYHNYVPVCTPGNSTSNLANGSVTVRGVNFASASPEAIYNWEIFYHTPIAAATYLSRQHRFEDARKWFHIIFDPTTNDPSIGNERFWNFLPFRSAQSPDSVALLLEKLSKGLDTSNDEDSVQNQIAAWLADPFNPFAVARLRNSAFEWYTVISYIKNLTDWADQLFRRDTRESINEATLLYIMASEILGPRPEKIRLKKDSKLPLSYRSLKASKGDLDSFSNVWLGMVSEEELEQASQQSGQGDENEAYYNQLLSLASIGSLYFNVPANEKLPELWDMVDDRLFKIRHCQNIEGVRRSLPLYEPPIDPELLIRAKAAGLDLADVLANRFAPLPHYRFQILLQKANEFCSEVKNLGGAILSAVEKKEAEHLALLRSSQEIDMLKLIESIKQEQIKEAEANIDALNKTKNNALDRFVFLQRQLGKNEVTLDATGVPIVEQSLITQVQETGTPNDVSSLSLINNEVDQLWKMQAAQDFATISTILKTSSGIAHLAGGAPIPAGPIATALGHALSVAGDSFGMVSSVHSYLERRANLIGGWQRRRDEWVQQSKMTAEEIRQIDKQIIALEIRQAIATKELDNHRKQIENASNIDDYMRHMKFTGESLYGWMESQISGLYFSAYQMAYDLAKKAEHAYQFELGEPKSNFVQYGHWDSLRKGLLSGERLSQNLRRMEVAHLERNKRELEITKHISLRQLDPLALMTLRETGECNFNLPEVLFDIDFPRHYFRRIKSVSISVPCVVGPYTSVNGTLTLESSKLRDKAIGDYDSEGDNYEISHLPTQSIATSSGQNDSGVFELNFRDERYLPFEGRGVISNWQFKLPKEFRPFDYDTISDVILHVRYTARDGGEEFAKKVGGKLGDNLNELKAEGEENGLWLLIDLRHDFPEEWSRYNKSTSEALVEIKIGADMFPYILRGKAHVEEVKIVDEEFKVVTTPDSPIKIVSKDDVIKIKVLEAHFNKGRWIELRYAIKLTQN